MKTVIIVFLLIASFILPMRAESDVGLDYLVQEGKTHNPEIAAAREKLAAARARIGQEKTWDKVEFFVDYRKIPEGKINLSQAEEKEYGVTQMFPFPGKLTLKGRIARSLADKVAEEYRQTELTVLSQIKIVYAAYFYATQSAELFKNISEIVELYSRVAESKYAAGSARQSDVLRARIEIAKLMGMTVMAEQEKASAQVRLNVLLGRDSDEPLGRPKDVTTEFGEIYWEKVKKAVVANSPLVKSGAFDVAEKIESVKLARADFLPDLGLTYRYRKMTGAMDTQDLMFGLQLPLWFWKQNSNLRQMASELRMFQAERKNSELMAVAEAREFFLKLQTAKKLFELYRTGILPQAEQLVGNSGAEYQAGRGGFLELAENIRSLWELKLDYYKNITEYYQNLASLEKIAGVELGK